MRRSRLATVAKYAAFAVLIALLSIALSRNFGEVKDKLARLSLRSLVAAQLAVLLGLACTMFAWRELLGELGTPLKRVDAARIYFLGQLGKYVPGSVWPVVMQMELGNAIGLARPAVASAGILGIGYGLGTGAGVMLLAAPALLANHSKLTWAGPGLGLVALCLLCLPRPMNRLVTIGLRLTRRQGITPAFTAPGLIRATGWMVASWVLFGLQIAWLAHDLGAVGAHVTIVSVGAFTAAVCVGLVVIFAPAGAGARELLLVVLLKPVLARDPATALALVSRLLQSLGDVVVAVSAIITTRGARMAARRRNPVTIGEDETSGGISTG